MALVYGQGATYDAIEGRFRRYRKMADDLRSEAQLRGVSVNQVNSTPRTPRGPRSRPTPASSKGKSSDKSKKAAMDDSGSGEAFPETPSKKPKLDTTSPGLSALTAIALDDSESEICKEKHEENAKVEVGVSATPIKSRLARSGSPGGTPTPVLHRVKREDLAAGSLMSIKRSIESSAEEQRNFTGVVQNMGVKMDLEVDTDDEDIA